MADSAPENISYLSRKFLEHLSIRSVLSGRQHLQQLSSELRNERCPAASFEVLTVSLQR